MGNATDHMFKSFLKSPTSAAIAAFLIRLYLRLLNATSSKTIVGRDRFDVALAQGRGVILVFWHGRLMLAPFIRHETDADVHMLISLHRDGEIIARAVDGFGIKFIRGSSANPRKPGKSKHGAAAVAAMLSALENGDIVAITPDGPRGPAETVQEGALRIAQRSGAAILAGGISSSRGPHLKSWDRFLMATPFTRLTYVAGEPLFIPKDATDEMIENFRHDLQNRLVEATAKADQIAGRQAKTALKGEP